MQYLDYSLRSKLGSNNKRGIAFFGYSILGYLIGATWLLSQNLILRKKERIADTSHRSLATHCKPEVNRIYSITNWVLGMRGRDYHNIIFSQLNGVHRLILSYSEVDHCMVESFPLCTFMVPGNTLVEAFTAP